MVGSERALNYGSYSSREKPRKVYGFWSLRVTNMLSYGRRTHILLTPTECTHLPRSLYAAVVLAWHFTAAAEGRHPVGFFGSYVFDGSTWHRFDPDSDRWPDIAAPWLSVSIHDSDIATVRYEPGGPGSGTAYLGSTPRVYFGDESASAPADMLREAEGLASWLARQQGRRDEIDLRDLIASFLADDIPEQRLHVDTDVVADAGDLDDAEIFVEVKVSRFLRAVGLPVPHELVGT